MTLQLSNLFFKNELYLANDIWFGYIIVKNSGKLNQLSEWISEK